MKFIKILWFDIKNGYLKVGINYIFPVLLSIMSFFEVYRKNMIWETTLSFGDCWMYLYGGMKEYIPTAGNAFQFPTMWTAVFLLCAFSVSNYPMKNLQTVGMQILVRAQGRKKWWVSKCLWNLFSTIMFHGIILLTQIGLSVCFQIPLVFETHGKSVATMFGLLLSDFQGAGKIPVTVFLAPLLFSLAINLTEMVITLWTKPVFGFLFICVLLISSAYLFSDKMIGNYAMPIRYNWAIRNGIYYQKGMILSAVILVGAFICGAAKFHRYNILNREDV